MASKQYISIIRLLEYCEIATGDDFNLVRAKKQLQAEFGITPGGFIEVNGYTYSRHDVFAEIENPDFPKRLAFHKGIWNSPQILALLEKNTVNFTLLEHELKPFSNNKDFDFFFSPYFAGPFNYLSRTFLSNSRLNDMADLLRYQDFVQPIEWEEAYRPLRIFLDENIKLLRNVNGENYKIMRPKISHWITTEWHVFFNYLPPEFYDIKNEITLRLINIGVAVQKSHRRDCKKVSKQLIALEDTPQHLRGTIVSNHAIYTRSSGGSGSWKGRGFWLAWIIFMLIRAASTNGCSDNTYQKGIPPYGMKYQISDSIFKRIVADSSLKLRH